MAKSLFVPEDLLRIVGVSDPTFRPGRDEVLYTRKSFDEKYKARLHIWSTDFEGESRQWTSGEGKNWGGRWDPRGERLAFLSDRAKPTQIYLLAADGGEAAALTELAEGSFRDLKWSPDGRHILFSFRETHGDFTEKAMERRKESGESDPPKVVETAYWRLDGDGMYLDQRYALYLVEVESRKVRKVYDGCPVGEYTYDWAPDGNRFALTRTFADRPWIDPIGDEIVLVGLDGSQTQVPGLPKGSKSSVRWSPDGKWLAYLGGDDPLDHRGVKNTKAFFCPVEGGEARCVTADIDLDLATYTLSDTAESPPEFLEWAADSASLYAQWAHHGQCHAGIVDIASHKFVRQTRGQFVLTPCSARPDGRIACIHSAPDALPEIAIADLAATEAPVRRITAWNDEIASEKQFAMPEEAYIHASDGYPVHVWKLNPSGKRSGAGVLEVHGGPQCQYGWNFFLEFQVLTAAGYTVVYSNPRGSKGYGQKHVEAIAGKWGQKDWIDVEAAKDWMKGLPEVDPARIGIMGGSYGGYMVNWAVGHTNDFRAAITDRCVSNLISKSLNTDYPYHPGTYWQGAAYEGFEGIRELWRDSPIAYFSQAKTPMLIIHSEGDLRCHIEQGEQVYTALQELGVPCRFVRYPASTSHGMSRGGPPDLRIHRLREILNWWGRWLG